VGVLRVFVGILFLLLTGVMPATPHLHVEYSAPEELEVKILEKLFLDLLKKEKVKVFVVGDRGERYRRNVKKFAKKLSIVSSCKEADITLIAGFVERIPKDCLKGLLFSTKKEHIFKFKNCLGALYWKKGRPNLVLIREKLEKHGIELPSEYERFIESEVRVKELKRETRV